MLGEWIDGRTDEERDRIVRGTSWVASGAINEDVGRCLMQHACGSLHYQEFYDDDSAGHRFDELVIRFGLDRVVRACKKRAGASLEDVVALTPEREAVEV